jgi:tetratricopeptide (TPR) repeat protein
MAADPNLLMAFIGMGDVHYAAGRYNTAAAYFEEACAIASYAPAYRFLGDCLVRLGDRAGAIICYRKALIIDPDYGMARAGLAALLKGQRESEAVQSATAVRPAVAEPKGTAQLHERIAALTRRERVRPDLSRIVNGLVERAPIIAQLLAADSLAEQEDLVRANLEPTQYPGLFGLLQVLVFFYPRLEGRTRDSLRISQLGLRIIEMLPESWQPQEVDDTNRAGLLAEAFLSVSRARLRVGEPQQALADALRADSWVLQSEGERKRDGIVSRPRLERIFGLTTSVRAEIQETVTQIYHMLGDENGRREYERHADGITADEERTSDAGADPEQWHSSVEELLAHEQFSLDKELSSRINEVSTMGVAHALVSVASILNYLSLHRSALSYMYKALELNVHQGAVDRACDNNIVIGNILLKRRDLGDAAAAFETALKLASSPQADGGEFSWTDSDGTDWSVYDGEPAFAAAAALADEFATRGRRDEAHQFIQLSLALREATRATIATESHRISYQTRHTTAYQVAVGLYVGMAAEASDPESLVRRAFQEVERARGRAFLDVMGTTPLPPPEGVPEALLERERDHLTRLEEWRLSESVDLADYEQLRAGLKAVWQAMSTYPATGSYLALREGRPVLFDELRALLTAG